jgi:multidrug resistance efflux pump
MLLVLGTAFYFGRGFLTLRPKSYPPNAFHQVKRADMLISVTEEGALRALNETVVRSGLEGFNRIIHLVPEGSYVQKDELLVELDSSGLRDRLNEQELLHQERLFIMLQAKGNLEIQKSLAESQIKDAELRVENAEADIEKYRDGDAPLLIKTVEARTGVLAEQVRIASERNARTEELFKTGAATRSEVEADALSLKREQLALSQYREDLRLIKKYDQPNQLRLLQSQLDQAKGELNRLRQRTSNEIAQAEADLKTSQASVDFLDQSIKTQKRRLESSKIFAPQNGLVVYAPVSPFQFGGDEGRRDEGRFRGGRGDRMGGERSGEFRGGGRRGGGGMSASGNGAGGAGGVSGVSSTAETVAAGNQRIASAVSGTSATEPGTSAGGGQSSGNSLGGSSGGGRSSGGGGGGGSAGGSGTASAAGAFASYQSVRPSSAFAYSGASATTGNGSTAKGANTAGSSSSGTSGSEGSTSSERSSFSTGNQFSMMRSMSQSFGYGGFESFGTPGVLQEGIMVRQRQELIRLPDVSKMLAEVKINESRVSQVRPGMTAYIQVSTIPHRQFKGTVRRVAPLPDAQASWMTPNVKVYPTDIIVDEELPLLKPGVSATAEIIITNLSKVLSVPIQAVTRFRGESVCFTKRGARVVPVPVTTGWFNDAFIEITAGLKDGDLVLLAPVGDEEIEEKPEEETNQITAVDERSMVPDGRPTMPDGRASVPASQPPVDEPFSEERRMRRRDPDSTNGGGAFPERGRFRQSPGSARRPQNSPDAPE